MYVAPRTFSSTFNHIHEHSSSCFLQPHPLTIQNTGCFFSSQVPPLKVPSTTKLIQARLGVSRPIYVDVDSPNLGFPYFNILGEYQWKNTQYEIKAIKLTRSKLKKLTMTNLQTSPHPTLLRPTPPLHPAQSHLATPLPSLAPSAPLRSSHTSLMAADCQVSEFPSNPPVPEAPACCSRYKWYWAGRSDDIKLLDIIHPQKTLLNQPWYNLWQAAGEDLFNLWGFVRIFRPQMLKFKLNAEREAWDCPRSSAPNKCFYCIFVANVQKIWNVG